MKDIRRYLFQAWYDWMCDSSLTPHIIAIANHPDALIPSQYISPDNTITLNISPEAVQNLECNEDSIALLARFSEDVETIKIPFEALVSIFAEENGKGTLFMMPEEKEEPSQNKKSESDHLKII